MILLIYLFPYLIKIFIAYSQVEIATIAVIYLIKKMVGWSSLMVKILNLWNS